MKTIKNDENCTIRKMLYKEESLHEKNIKKLTTESEKKKKKLQHYFLRISIQDSSLLVGTRLVRHPA